jgi:Ca-activated chloride channel homolog
LRGLFRIRPLVESAAFPEVGLYRQQEESQDYGSNEGVLRQISALTGGRFNPDPSTVFAGDGRTIYTLWQLWPGLLGLAILLSLAELITRKWNGVKQGLLRLLPAR